MVHTTVIELSCMMPKQDMIKNTKKLIVLALSVVFFMATKQPVLADCEPNYGGGETCVVNKRFEIKKEVRLEGEDTWKDKITDVKEGDVIEFRIKIKNLSDDEAEDFIDFDDMEMKDILPDELYRIGGDQLKEQFDNFKPGETEEFIIKVKVDEAEFDTTESFEKCVVNKAEIYWDDNFEGADTAIVCYGIGTPQELPKTGFGSTMTLIGIALIGTGLVLFKSKKLAR